jgi:hypothetical protein
LAPTIRSSRVICCDSDCWAIVSRAAARVKLDSSATATK